MRYFLPNWIRRKIITHHKSNVPAHTLIVCRWVKNEAKESAQRCRRITNYRFQLQFTYHFFVIHHLSPVIDRCRRLFVTTCFPHTHKQHNTKRIANGTALKCATHHFLQCKTRSREKKMPNEQWQNAKKSYCMLLLMVQFRGGSALLTFWHPSHWAYQQSKCVGTCDKNVERCKKKKGEEKWWNWRIIMKWKMLCGVINSSK